MDEAYGRFAGTVRSLWPAYKCTDESLRLVWQHKMGRYDEATIGNALRHQRIDDPDATRPIWKSIYRYLGDLGHRDGKSPLAILLAQVRDAAKDLGTKHVDEWSDADAWHHWLRIQIQPYHTKRATAEATQKEIKRVCENTYRTMRDELTGGGWDIPSYLNEEAGLRIQPGPAVELKADPQLRL